MAAEHPEAPDSTAVRTALWRAMHVQVDAPPHVLQDEIGLRLADPDEGWRGRPDMDPRTTRTIRAVMVARARFIEDLIIEQSRLGVRQYVILGAGLDTFAQREPEIASHLRIFEVDRPGPQAWKRNRLAQLGYDQPDWLHLVPVDFEASEDWLKHVAAAGFDAGQPAVIVSTGVTMYLTSDATTATLRQIAGLAPGTSLAMTFMLPIELADAVDRPGLRASNQNAEASGTPFISFYTPSEILALAREAGFKEARHVSAASLSQRYFADRSDGLQSSSGEDLLLARIGPRGYRPDMPTRTPRPHPDLDPSFLPELVQFQPRGSTCRSRQLGC